MENEKQAAKALTPEEQKAWVRQQYQAATKYLSEKGMITESVSDKDSRYLVPFVAVWKLNLINKSSVWVICGDVPTDHVGIDAGKDVRSVMRHFSLKWQMQANKILNDENTKQKDFANLLIGRAEGLYDMCENEEIWAGS
jgi:hypothetical protein